MSRDISLLEKLETYYSVEDVYLMLEIGTIDSHNRFIASKQKPRD